jgi:DegV family protein with EDD domain
MLRIVTDGGADMPEEWLREYDIHVLPLRLRFGEETYTQGVDIDQSNFYTIVNQKKMIPGTSLPSPQQIMDFYRQIAQKGDDILSIHLSSKLSGTFAVVQMAAMELVGEFNVVPFDSGAGSAVLGYMCREARKLSTSGISIEKILHHLESIKQRLIVIFTLDTLEFARMNGRVSAFQDAVTSLLNIKPIIILRDGMLTMGDKVRTRQKALERVVKTLYERVNRNLVDVFVVHASDLPAARTMMGQIRGVLNIHDLFVTDLSIPVAANLGPGTVGVVVIPVCEE